MSYLVFARKYRPQGFDEVIGQEHITTTLKNAIELDRVAHAYLFAGPRGIGKTTTARILAKALNCEKGPTSKPCSKCQTCLEITGGSSLDILEIDGASNRGIDEVRNLRESVKFAPSKARFKVYIIDEVHMLTAEAFNALLKTLEEPPPHVKFIFATTQAHKVPPTILSRCQRFDFRRIPKAKIMASLAAIAGKEGIDASDDALEMISRHAEGSMRDAEVVLDQAASFVEGRLTADDIVKMLGIVADDALFDLADFIASMDSKHALGLIDSVINSGRDPSQLSAGLIEHFRNLLVARVAGGESELIDSSPEKMARLVQAANRFSSEELLYFIYTLSGAADLAKKTNLSRIPLEIAIVKLCGRANVMSLDEALQRLKDLEARIENVPPLQPAAPARPRNDDLRTAQDAGISPAASAPSPGLDVVLNQWQAVLGALRLKKISVASFLLEGRPVAIEDGCLVIGFPGEFKFHKDALEDNLENKKFIEEALKDVVNTDYRIKFILNASGAKPGLQEGRNEKSNKLDPVITEAMDIFDGEVIGRDKASPKGRT